jgi:hypothetical protein
MIDERKRIRNVIIDYKRWHGSIKTNKFVELMQEMERLGVEEVTLSVGDEHWVNTKWNLELIRPKSRPYTILDRAYMTRTLHLTTNRFTWEGLEVEALQVISNLQNGRAIEQQKLLDSRFEQCSKPSAPRLLQIDGVTLEDLDSSEEYANLKDFSKWTIKREYYREGVDTSDENAAELGNHRDMSLAGSFWR